MVVAAAVNGATADSAVFGTKPGREEHSPHLHDPVCTLVPVPIGSKAPLVPTGTSQREKLAPGVILRFFKNFQGPF